MKSLLTAIITTAILFYAHSQSTKDAKTNKKNKTSSSSTESRNNPIEKTKTNTVSSNTPLAQKQSMVNPTNPVIETNVCKACNEFDGKIKSMDKSQGLNFDSVIDSYSKNIDLQYLNGGWRYEKTFIFSNHNYLVEKTRNFFRHVPEEILPMSKDSMELIQNMTKDQYIDMRIENRKKEAAYLGRDEAYLEDMMIPFDNSVIYNFFNNDGELNDHFAITRITSKKILQNLTTSDIMFKTEYIQAFKKYYLELYYPGTKSEKKFRILTLTNSIMILADERFNEIQYFRK